MNGRARSEGRMHARRFSGVIDLAAVLTLGAGMLCLGVYAVAEADQRIAATAAAGAFHAARERALGKAPDQALWSGNRRAAWVKAALFGAGTPRALLRIPSIDLLAPVYDGTGELALNRGIGWIEGTSRPGLDGNIGLAGHRDGFFRRLEKLRVGDSLEIQTVESARRYRVIGISIVTPADVHVLDPTVEPSVTLVTCYPFYFVGAAPQRFVVRAVIDATAPSANRQGGKSDEYP
jgi:sortase A